MTKLTEPGGVPAPEVTVAVNVTDWPKTDGLTLELTAVAVAAGAMITVSGPEVVAPIPLVADTVKLNAPPAVGVPESTPAADRVSPVGSVPLATAQLIVA